MEEGKSLKLVTQARKTRGYIFKKSRGFFTNWQKRYFIIINDNLEYYADESLDHKKGTIDVNKIKDIQLINDLEFIIIYQDRKYEMKCANKEDRSLWSSSIKILINQYLQLQLSLRKNSPKKVKKQIQYKNQNNNNNNHKQLQTILHSINLDRLLKYYSINVIENKFIYLITETGIYWLLSSKCLDSIQSDYQIFYDAKSIKPYDYNILYFNNENREIKEICKSSEIRQIVNHPSSLLIQYEQGRGINIDTESMTMLVTKKFAKKLRKSILIGKQYHNEYKLKIVKNIDLVLSQFDNEKYQKLKQNIKKQFERQSNKYINLLIKSKPNQENLLVQQFFRLLQNINNNLQDVYNACKVKLHPRYDFFAFYSKKVHQIIYPLLNEGWNQLYNKLTLDNIGRLCNIVYKYQLLIQDYVKDQKIDDGIHILFKIYLRKRQEELLKIIKLCVDRSQSIVYQQILTNKITNQILQKITMLIKSCKSLLSTQKSVIQIYYVIKNIFKSYCYWINEFTQNIQSINLLLGICNDIDIIRLEYFPKLFEEIRLNNLMIAYQKNCEKDINQYLYNTKINLIKRLFIIEFSNIDRKLLNKNLGEIDISKLIQQIDIRVNQFTKIRQNVKISILLTSFDQICYFYYNCIVKFINNSNFTPQQISKKIIYDLQKIQNIYQKRLPKYKIKDTINDLLLLKDFILCDISNVNKLCKLILRNFGSIFTQDFLKKLINLRNNTIQIKKKLFQQCSQIIKTHIQNQDLIFVDNFIDPWSRSRSRSRKSTLTISIKQKDNMHLEIIKFKPDKKQGYLLKKKVLKTVNTPYYRAYFKLEQGRLYEYEQENSTQYLQSYNLFQAKKCAIDQQENNVIVIQFNQVYKFKAINAEQTGKWLQKFYEEISAPIINKQNSSLFKDYFADSKTTQSSSKLSISTKKIKKQTNDGCSCSNRFFF